MCMKWAREETVVRSTISVVTDGTGRWRTGSLGHRWARKQGAREALPASAGVAAPSSVQLSACFETAAQ